MVVWITYLPDQAGAGVGQMLPQKTTLDDKRQHLLSNCDDHFIRLREGVERYKSKKKFDLQMIKPRTKQKVPLEWASSMPLQTALESKMSR
jgi:hypothetical protein